MLRIRKLSSADVKVIALRTLRNHARDGFTKLSELGGDGQDLPFEQAFSNVAHAYLRDKAPSLLDHELGFQLLDRNQDNTKAIGICVFKLGATILLAPVFWLNGDLKGHELLYLKNQDQFVPLEEDWINDLISRKPNILGEGVDRNSSKLGVRNPDLQTMRHSPLKFASDQTVSLRSVVEEALPALAHAATSDPYTDPKFAGIDDLPGFLKQAGLEVLEKLITTCSAYPEFAHTFDQFYGLNIIGEAVKLAGERARRGRSVLDPTPVLQPRALRYSTGSVLKAAAVDSPHVNKDDLQVIRFDLTQQPEPPGGLDDKDNEKLLRDGVLIKDKRDSQAVSIPYNTQVEQQLANPAETGLYEVLTKPGEFERCYVIMHPVGPCGSETFCTVLRVGDNRNWLNSHPTNIWVGAKIDGPEFDDWFAGLPDVEELTVGNSRMVLIGPRGNGTVPFRVLTALGNELGTPIYEVSFDTYCDYTYRYAENYLAPHGRDSNYARDSGYDKYRDGERLHLRAKDGTQLIGLRGDVYVPKGYKKLLAQPDRFDRSGADAPGCDAGMSEPPPIRPGNIADAQLMILTKTAALTIYHNGTDVEINRARMSPIAGFISLISDHGFREDIARTLLKEAQRKGKQTWRVKYASPYLRDSGPNAPPQPPPVVGGDYYLGSNTQMMPSQENQQVVPELMGRNTDPNLYNPNTMYDKRPMDMSQGVQQSMGTGQADIFGQAVLGQLLKSVSDESMVDRYIGDLKKGLDRLGRILFMFYWHGDKFAERYGKGDMPELEDSLRNAFEMMGRIVIFLMRKTIQPYPEEMGGMKLDLQDTAN